MSTKLFVGNLSFNTNNASLTSAFSNYGDVQEVKVIMDSITNRSRGFAFVEMGTKIEAEEAITNLNGTEIEGRTIVVSVAKEREPRTDSRSKMMTRNW